MALPRGARLGPYEVLAPLGAGGMGEVYRARDTRLGREVALKVLPDEVSSDRQRLARFQQEARMASSLSHPNIITIHDVGDSDGASFIVMELAEGRTLRALLASGPLPTLRLLQVGVQVAEGLAKAHGAGMVHRDLKPENIMVTADGLVKILDFGLAKPAASSASADLHEETTLSRMTDPGTVVGTVSYMSPEQASGQRVDFRSDQFALGAILYEAATGRGPFQRGTAAETLTAILREEPPPVASLNPHTPPGLARILERCLAKDPSRRYAATLDLARDLQEEMDRLSAPSGAAVPAAGPRRRLPFLLVGVGLLAAIAAAWLVPRLAPRRGAIDSLAVLPFVNASGDPGLEYLSDGLTENLINSISQVSNPKVIARSSVFRYKGQDVTPEQVARDLAVRAELVGRVSEHGDQLSVSVELVDAAENVHLWGAQYNRKPSDLLATEEDIAREISENLRPRLTGDEKRRLTRGHTEDPEAYRLYLKGRYFWNQRTKDDVHSSIEYFRQAIDRDPTYALAYTGLADAYGTLGLFYYQFAPPPETFPLAREAARKALELDPRFPAAHVLLGEAYEDQHRYADAEREFRSVQDAFAGTSRVQAALARIHALSGRRAVALRELQELAEDRTGRYVAPHDLAWGYAALGDRNSAMQWLEKAYAERSSALTYLKIEPLFDPMRGDPRFADLVRRVGIP